MPKKVEYVTKDEFERILKLVEQDPDAYPPTFGLLLRTFWATGCRPAELVGRRGRTVEHAGSRVKDHHGLRPTDLRPDYRLFIEGKNTTPSNAGQLKPRVVLCADTSVWRELRKRGQRFEDQSLNLFLPNSTNGMAMIQRYVERIQDNLDGRLTGFSLRWLRHSHAIYSLRNGVDLVSLQRQLGHERLTTTANYLKYAGLDDEPYLAAFDHEPPDVEKQCPSCGFQWREDPETGEPTWEARMGKALRRRH